MSSVAVGLGSAGDVSLCRLSASCETPPELWRRIAGPVRACTRVCCVAVYSRVLRSRVPSCAGVCCVAAIEHLHRRRGAHRHR
jgi:hypothetical protein